MSYLSKLVAVAPHRDVPPKSKKGTIAVRHVVETVEYAGASYLFGYIQNRYRNKATVFGVPVDLAAGVLLKGASLTMDLLGKSEGLSSQANLFGNAGIGAFFHTLGSGQGGKAAGIRRALVKESDVKKLQAMLPDATILGVSEKAPVGDFLKPHELVTLAAQPRG